MPITVRPPVDSRSAGDPATVIPIKSPADPSHHTSLIHQLTAGSVESFSDASSSSSESSRSSRSAALYQMIPDNAESLVNPSTEVSKPQSRGEVSPPQQLLDFCQLLFHHDSHFAYLSFLRTYPEYKLTRPLDILRKCEYKRLKRSDEVYMDYMGASLYPESLINSNSAFLRQAVLGNTHSFSTR